MAWRPITVPNILGRMTVSEQSMLTNASGATSKLQERLTDAIGVFYSAMSSQSYTVGTPPSMCDRFRNEVMSMAVWEFLLDFPQLKVFKTDERKRAYTDARQLVVDIANRKAGAIEPPNGVSITGNWNSINRVIGRMENVPPPIAQFETQGSPFPWYSNPNATSSEPLLTVPDAPKNLWIYTGSAGQLTLSFIPPSNAFTFNIWKGTASGNETLLASGITNPFYLDTAVIIGQTYWYYVTGTSAIGTSANSNEAFGTVAAANSNN